MKIMEETSFNISSEGISWEPYATYVKLFKDPKMSMLAQPRKKQKWSIDPRNSNWSKDDSKFGQKLMERMGWSKGKGLGISEQGMVDHVKVKVKNDQLGIGNSASYEDNWIAHQDDFNELLAQLNNCHGQNGSAEAPPPEEPKAFSLEEKSKSSKKRVHYMKFAKGKDLSSRSETDLNCIFGKRGKAAKPEQESNGSDSPGETKETAAFELDTESITNTVTSALSMQEYFAQRMAQLKNGRGEAQSTAPSMEADETSGPSDEPSPVHDDDDSEEPSRPSFKLDSESNTDTVTPPINVEEYFAQRMAQLKKRRERAQSAAPSMETDETSGPPDEPGPILIIDDNSEEPKRKKKKKKKKKRSKKSADDLEVVEENSTAVPVIVIEDNEETLQECSGQKKRKVVESEGATKENCGSTSGVEQDCEELPPSKKKKKKLKRRHEEAELLNGHGPPEEQTVEPEVALKKKKKHRVELDDVAKEEEELVEKKSKKDKKKKQRIG